LYDPKVPEQPKSKRGQKPKKGAKLPSPKEVAQRAVKWTPKTGPGTKVV
jgi:hypothetical protein